MNVSKSILCGTALIAVVFSAAAHAQATIGGDVIDVNGGSANTGGTVDTDGGDLVANNGTFTGGVTTSGITFANGGLVTNGRNINTVGGRINLSGGDILNGDNISTNTIDVVSDATVGGNLTTSGITFANGGLVTNGRNINTVGGRINLSGGDIINADNIGANSIDAVGNATVGGDLTTTGITFANGGLVTNGRNINTVGGRINLSGGDIINGGAITTSTLNATTTNTGTLAVTSNATIGQDLTVGRNINATGDIITVNGSVGAGSIRLNGANGRITGVSAGVAATDAVNVGQLNSAVTTLNARIDTVNTRVDVLTGRVSVLESDAKKAFQGVAMGFAMNAAPLNLANGEGGLSGGAGIFEGEVAGAIRAQFVTETGFGIGANVGFSGDALGGGVGASIKF